MPGAAIGALLGFAFSGALAGASIFSIFGMSVGTLWLVGASIGSLFDAPSLDLGNTTPNYSFGQLSNTKSQLLPVPIVYGRCRVGGNVFMQTFYDDSLQKMDMFVGVSEGPVQSIKSVYANDLVLIDENGDVVHELADSSINLHLGAPDQAADSREPTGSTYPNTAYIALTLKAQDKLTGNPVISSIVEGRKVWTPSGTKFSRNPAWIVYDFLTNTRYGVGIPTDLIDLDSFTDAATYCDAPIDGEPRFTLDYIIDTQRPAVDHLQAMLGCFRGYFLARDKIELHVEQAGSVYKELTEDNFVKGTFSWWQKSGDDSPNRIVIEWIDPNNHYEQSSAPFEWTEDIAARGVYEKSISLLGVTRPEQVGRLGNYLLETAKRVQNFCAFQVSLKDADIEAGEVISITHQDFTGWSAKPFRVLKVQDEGQTGNVTITCAEYDAAIYADDALTVDLPVIETPPVTTDDVYALELEDVGFLDDGKWTPVIRASWQNPGDYTPTAINVRWRYDGETDWNLSLNSTRLITQARIEGLKSGETVEVWVNCVRPDTGKETTGQTTSMVVGKDVTPPGACTGLAATGWFGSIILEWTNPPDKDLNYVELWENAVDDRFSAVKIAEVKGAGFTRYLGSFQGRYYWVRGVDLSGNIGPWNADDGVYGNSDQETHQDFVDLLLEDNPYLHEAIDDLNTRIDPIESDLGIIVDIVQPDNIDTTLPELVNVTLPGITDRLETVEVDLPGAVQRLAERMKEIDADVMDQLRAVSSSAVDALLNIAEIGQRITDAGIVVDPDNGEVRIWAVDQLRTEHGVRLSNAEQLISAQAGIISQKVGIADVDARIAQAVFGNVGELLVSGLEAHITSVEQELNAAKGELAQKATVVEVDAIGGRVGTAESKISGLEASVALKATQEEVDELTSRVTTAEFTVDALNGTIGSEIVAIGQEGRDLANLTAEGLVEAILNDSENHDRAKIQLATAKTEIYARVEEGLSAEAGQRTALAAVVDGNYSTYLQSTELLTNNLRAEVTQREQLQSQVDGLDGSVISLSGAVAGKADVIYSATPPENAKNNDLWCATADSGTYKQGSFYRLVEEVWTKITDPILLQTLDPDFEGSLAWKADQIEAVANSKNRTFRQYTAPTTGMSAGDLWFDSDDNNKAYRYNGSSWIQTDDLRIAANMASISAEAFARADADSAEAKRVNVLFSGSEGDPLADPPSPTSVRGRLQTSEETLATHTSSLARYGRQLTASIEANVTESATAPASPTPGMVWKCTATSGAYAGKFWIWDRTSESNPYGWREIKGVSGNLYGSVKSINASVTNLSGAIAGKSDVIYAATPPEDAKSNDIWCATASSGGYEAGAFYRLSGGTWTKITDPFLVRALDENFEGSLAYDLKSLNGTVGNLSSTIDEITEASATESTATGSFTRNMVAQLGNQVGSGLVEDILNQADGRKRAVEQYAAIREDYEVKIEAGISSEASKRELLASRIGDAEGAILQESVTRSTNDQALARDITKLQADFGANSVKIEQESEARATETAATGTFSTTLLAQLGNQVGSGLVEDILNQADARKNAVQQYAMIRQDYNVKIEEGLLSEATARELLATRVGANESAILSEAVSRSTADDAMAQTINAISVKANKNEADIKTELETRADADEAVAKQVTTLAASTLAGDVTESAAPPGSPTEGQVYYNTTSKKYFWWDGTAWQEVKGVLGKNTAAIQTESIARTTEDESLASQITTLETTTVGGDVTESATAPEDPETGEFYYNTTEKKYFRWNGTEWVEIKGIEGHSRAAIKTVNESVDGIKAKHGVYIDINGYVTGYELIGGDGEGGSMIFRVDKFLIGQPDTETDYPFALGTVTGDDGVPVTRLSLKNAWIQDGAIKNANIDNLTIGRIKLASGATAGLSWGESTFSSTVVAYTANGVYTPAGASVRIRTESRGRVMVSAYMRAQHWHSTLNMWLYRNGVKILDLGGSGGGAYDPATPVMCFWVDKSPPDSSNTAYSIRVQKISGEAVYVHQRGISVTAIYR